MLKIHLLLTICIILSPGMSHKLQQKQRRATKNICKTVSGEVPYIGGNGNPDPGKECVFPFTHKGKTYRGCPPDPYIKGKRWCSTATDAKGNHITGKGKFGICEETCLSHVVKGNCTTNDLDVNTMTF